MLKQGKYYKFYQINKFNFHKFNAKYWAFSTEKNDYDYQLYLLGSPILFLEEVWGHYKFLYEGKIYYLIKEDLNLYLKYEEI